MKNADLFTIACLCLMLAGTACPSSDAPQVVLRPFPLLTGGETITKEGVSFDPEVSTDGNGTLKITADGPRVVEMFRTGDLDLENTRLIYRARLKTQGVEGQVYLEMYCDFAGKGSFFSRGLQSPLTGTTDWTTVETPFFLKKGENPDDVALNLVFTGKGTAWIDDIELLRAPLR
jgi:hypothetical protein